MPDLAGAHPPIDAWRPLSPPDLSTELFGLPLPWWIGGGWAIDLFVGRQTRPHVDTDVVVLRQHASVVLAHLAQRWLPFSTGRPTASGLEAWVAHHDLGPQSGCNSAWIAHGDGSSWAFQILFMDDEDGRWVFRRDRRIGGPLPDLGWVDEQGLLILRPEIQLLFKARLSDSRPKDDHDFEAALPHLTAAQRAWLAEAIETHQGPDHPWLPCLGVDADPPGV